MRAILNRDVRHENFQNHHDRLEKYATSMRLIYVVYTGLVFGIAYKLMTLTQNLSLEILFSITGFVIITFIEYAIHRFLFHHPNPNFFFRRIHLRHHADQDNSAHGVVPLPVSLTLISFVNLPFYFFLSSKAKFLALLLGTTIGYLVHETTHYLNHHYRPKTAWGEYFLRYHQFHHQSDKRYNYGFMVPFWDMLFGTYKIE